MEPEAQRVVNLFSQKVGQLTTELAVATALAQQWAVRATAAEAALAALTADPPPAGD